MYDDERGRLSTEMTSIFVLGVKLKPSNFEIRPTSRSVICWTCVSLSTHSSIARVGIGRARIVSRGRAQLLLYIERNMFRYQVCTLT